MAELPKPGSFAFGVLILAAGKSRRMGKPKLLLPWGNTSVLGHLLREWQALGARQIVAVCAGNDPAVGEELSRLGFPEQNRAYNPEPDLGMFSSIRCAAQWGSWDKALTHIVLVLGDQPHLRRTTLDFLLRWSEVNSGSVCQPFFNGHPQHPVMLPRAEFLSLATAPSATLLEFLVSRQVSFCEIDDPGLELDIDTPEDYQKALAMARFQASS